MDKANRMPVIETKKLTIKFGNLVANDSIDLKLYRGTIHAIAGENGAGKSTLMKMLYGVYTPTSGEIYIGYKRMELTPQRAIDNGIGMVFQDFRLIPAFTALENIILAMPNDGRDIRKDEVREKIRSVSEKYRIPVNPDMYVWEMDLGQRQRVEIIKVLLMGDNMKVLIFDEPTSVLTHHEAEAFLQMLIKLKENGLAIILITHKLHEVISCADEISILRHGVITHHVTREEGFDREQLISKMMGDEPLEQMDYDLAKKKFTDKAVAFTCSHLNIVDEHGRTIIRDINLTIEKGEIVGVAGISGRGQRELVETIYGMRKEASGEIKIEDSSLKGTNIKKRLGIGISYISEDPKRDNVVRAMSIRDHFLLAGLPMKKKGIAIDWKTINDTLQKEDLLKELGVPETGREMATLSGGNIQRAMLARSMMRHPKLLLASYPSRGLDIGTVEMVHKILVRLRNEGSSILLISEDLDELYRISDSLIVIADNRVLGKYNPKETTALKIGELMIGGQD